MRLLYCPNCLKESYYEFCSNCGTEMIPCPECNFCGDDLKRDQKFCTGCGRSREEALKTPPPEPSGKIIQFFSKLFCLSP
jgi:hypothetical protein